MINRFYNKLVVLAKMSFPNFESKCKEVASFQILPSFPQISARSLAMLDVRRVDDMIRIPSRSGIFHLTRELGVIHLMDFSRPLIEFPFMASNQYDPLACSPTDALASLLLFYSALSTRHLLLLFPHSYAFLFTPFNSLLSDLL